jgi:hypothetical protein
MNFIQLWTLSEHVKNSSKQVRDILNNMMEMLMSLCFQTLPQAQLSMFLAGHEHLANTASMSPHHSFKGLCSVELKRGHIGFNS